MSAPLRLDRSVLVPSGTLWSLFCWMGMPIGAAKQSLNSPASKPIMEGSMSRSIVAICMYKNVVFGANC